MKRRNFLAVSAGVAGARFPIGPAGLLAFGALQEALPGGSEATCTRSVRVYPQTRRHR